MINSDFDTVIRNDNNYSNNNKKSKFKIIIIIFIVLVVLALGTVGYLRYSEYKAKLPKIKFFENIENTDLYKLTDIKLFNAIIDKMNTSSYNIKTGIKVDTTITHQSEIGDKINEYQASEFNAEIDYTKTKENSKKSIITLNKESEKVLDFVLLEDENSIGVKSEEIVLQYLACKKNNISNLINNISKELNPESVENDSQFSQNNALENNSNSEFEQVSNTNSGTDKDNKIKIPQSSVLEKYKSIINEKLTDDKFKIENNVLLTQNNTSTETTLYELTLNKEEFLQLIEELKDKFVNDYELLSAITENKDFDGIASNIVRLLNGSKIHCSDDELGKNIEDYYSKIYDLISADKTFSFKFDIYVKDGKVIKRNITCGNLLEIDLESEQKSASETYAKITIVGQNEKKEKDGISVSATRVDNNVSTSLDFEISIIENMQINKKIIINEVLEGNESSSALANNLVITLSNTDLKLVFTLDSKINIGVNDLIENLNNEEPFYLDDLTDEEFNSIFIQISNRIKELIEEKKQALYNSGSDQNSNNQDTLANNNLPNDEKKIETRDKLISAIQNAMANKEDYALTDLQQLTVEGSTISVMVSENMAVVAIDGYTFYIDPNFNLTEE